MLTRARVRGLAGTEAVLELFRELGYPVAPAAVDAEEWRRAGIALGWNGSNDFRLAARLRRFDLFCLDGECSDDLIKAFLVSYKKYNYLTKSALIYQHPNRHLFSVYDLSSRQALRRLDVGLDEPSFHSVDRLNLLAPTGGIVAPHHFDLALDRERLTRAFFETFRDAVRETTRALAAAAPLESAESLQGQAVLVMSRLLFLSFVQEKGWLNGERRFLFDRLRARNCHQAVLAPLFFGCLNTPAAARDRGARKLGRIPYLNGGLFEPSPFEQRNPSAWLPDELLRDIAAEVFERFDFRSEESDVAGAHVDPEMLGKVFESLMAEEERAASGSFYTPREIVDVLTTRAVDAWLGEGTVPDLLARLETIAVLDPACGSGAFLLSALGVIERKTRALAACAGIEPVKALRQAIVERSLFGVDLKPEAVRLCELRLWLAIVSGADCEIEDVPPLPNLDRNILQGNSLLSPTDFLGDARLDIYREWVYAVRAQGDLVRRYRSAPRDERPALARIIRETDRRLAGELVSRAADLDERELQCLTTPQRDLFGRGRTGDHERCHELQQRIASSRRTLERIEDGTLDFFSFDVHFAPVLAAGGFDVVAGNPPWVRNARIEPRAKRMLSERYRFFRASPERAAFHQPDLSVAFFERALDLVAPGGIVAMLVPAKIANAAYAHPLRREVVRQDIIAIDDWSASTGRHFEANTFPLGLTVARRLPRSQIEVVDDGHSFRIAQEDLAAGSEWALVPPQVGQILRRIRSAHPPLSLTLGRRPLMGVKTGDNRAFFLGETHLTPGRLITADGISIPLRYVARAVRGRDVRRWSACASEWILWPPPEGWRTVPRWLAELAEARGMEPSAFRLSFVKPEHVGIKVAWKDLSRGMAAVALPACIESAGCAIPLVPNQTLYSIDAANLDEAYAFAAVLNSVVAGALLVAVAERAKDSHFRYFGRLVAAMPLPHFGPDHRLWPAFVRVSRQAHQSSPVGDEPDRLAAELYGLGAGELTILRRFVERRLGRNAG